MDFEQGDIVFDKKKKQEYIILYKIPLTEKYYCEREDGITGVKHFNELTLKKEKNIMREQKPRQEMPKLPIIASFLILLVLLLGFASMYTIDTGERGVLLTFGEASPISKEPGLHFKMPIAQKIVKMEVRTLKYESSASSASKDLQIVSTNVAVNFHLNPENVPKVYTELGITYYERIIAPAIQEVVKSSTAIYTAEELITKRSEVKLVIEQKLRENLVPRGIILEQVSITQFDFSESFNYAIEQKVTAEQQKLKAENDLERIRVEALQKEAQAIGTQKAIIAEAEGNNQAKILNAEAEAKSIEIIQQQLDESPQYIEWLKVTNWDGHLPKVTGGVIPMLDINSEVNNNG